MTLCLSLSLFGIMILASWHSQNYMYYFQKILRTVNRIISKVGLNIILSFKEELSAWNSLVVSFVMTQLKFRASRGFSLVRQLRAVASAVMT